MRRLAQKRRTWKSAMRTLRPEAWSWIWRAESPVWISWIFPCRCWTFWIPLQIYTPPPETTAAITAWAMDCRKCGSCLQRCWALTIIISLWAATPAWIWCSMRSPALWRMVSQAASLGASRGIWSFCALLRDTTGISQLPSTLALNWSLYRWRIRARTWTL